MQGFFNLKSSILFKWILAVALFFAFNRSFFGAIIGFIIGSGIDNYQNIMKQAGGANQNGRRMSPEDLFNYYQQRTGINDIATMLMALSAAVMKADGKVVKAELDYVKAFFGQQFGNQFNTSHLQTLKKFLDSDSLPLDQIIRDINMRMSIDVRIQLVHYLFSIAKSDGHVSDAEMNVIGGIAQKMGIGNADYESVKNMFYRDTNSDYKILEIEASATDEEVKKAYRKMAIKFHPDKVAQMGEEYQKGANEKFQEIQNAYEAIKKQRGF